MQAREAKEVEDPRTAIFVKGTHAGEKVNAVMKELVRLFEKSPIRAYGLAHFSVLPLGSAS